MFKKIKRVKVKCPTIKSNKVNIQCQQYRLQLLPAELPTSRYINASAVEQTLHFVIDQTLTFLFRFPHDRNLISTFKVIYKGRFSYLPSSAQHNLSKRVWVICKCSFLALCKMASNLTAEHRKHRAPIGGTVQCAAVSVSTAFIVDQYGTLYLLPIGSLVNCPALRPEAVA